jgi:tRNA A-37 threonylcarbamoyl transferase component Bud32
LVTGAVLAGFRIDLLMSDGAMGSVYRAEAADGQKVALKVLDSELARDERFRQRFLRESRVAGSLDHPHIVPTLVSGEEGGFLYLVMTYVDGSDLRKMLRAERVLEADRALDLLAQVADALDAAHAAGLVHRDVKPGNVLITSSSVGETAYICDFGLARHVSSVSSLTGERGFVGTIDYVSPEQIEGGSIDGRADIYSLGCMLFECLAGERPFSRDSELSVVYAHLNEPPPRISVLRPELPEEFDSVVATALAKSPNDRYASCRELIEAARAAQKGKAFASRRRRRRVFVVGAGVLVAAVAAVGGVVASEDGSPPAGRPEITQSSIGGVGLGLSAASYDRLFGERGRKDLFDMPQFNVDIFGDRGVSVYFTKQVDKGIIVTTWNKSFKTAAGVGPCSTIADAKSVYGSRFKPSDQNVIKGKAYAYLLGKNLIFAASGKPPHPSKYVTAVGLYEGSQPGVDLPFHARGYAGFVAISETSCR